MSSEVGISAPRRIVVYDDDADVRLIVGLTLNRDVGFDVVGEASTGSECIEVVGKTNAELVVMDLGLADTGGLQLISDVHRLAPWAVIVVFTGRDDKEVEAIGRGATSYVVKGKVSSLVEALGRAPDLPRTAVTTLDRRDQAPAAAAAWLDAAIEGWGCDDVADAAAVIAAEFITAAWEQGSRCDVRCRLAEDCLRIEVVSPAGPRSLPHGHGGAHAEAAAASMVVDALATAWGNEEAETGLTRWAEIARPRATEPPSA